MSDCPTNPTSESIADFIYRQGETTTNLTYLANQILCMDTASRNYDIFYLPISVSEPFSLSRYAYYTIPKLYTTMDTSSMEAAGITQVFQQPVLNNKGEGVLIGFIDTGIDYLNPLFRNPDGTSRIMGIWDQTLPAGEDVSPPGVADLTSAQQSSIQYGTAFTHEQINQALAAENPLSIVPSVDTNGHGTFLAGIAAGNELPSGDFTGAAPQAMIGMVKLKPAKKYLRDLYLIREDAIAFQENDIMMGVRYLRILASQLHVPLVICLGLGSNMGSHEGVSPLGALLQSLSEYTGIISVIAGGNEAGLGHHYLGTLAGEQEFDDVEIRVAPNERGFTLEFWADAPDLYSIGFISPSGEIIDRIPMSLGKEPVITFLLEPTTITVNYLPNESTSGRQSIIMRFSAPSAGVWHVRVYNRLFLSGSFHMWLPNAGFISPETQFLRPDPDTTLTNPANSMFPLSISAYNHRDGSIYIHSSRGFTINDQIKPDLAAPGVDITGPALTEGSAAPPPDQVPPMTTRTGTSVAAAHVAGAVASLLSWGIVEGHDPTMSNASIRGYLVRGAARNPGYTYPNQEFGYGTLDLYQSFLQLRE